MIMTMVDGKVCNAVAENTSTQKCYLCGLSSKHFNDINRVKDQPINEQMLEFGISPLHAWIRFFECLLHVSYKLEIGEWQARGEDNKQKVARRKKEIQDAFRVEMGLLVDVPKVGSGNTNDGNTARRFFGDAATSAKITGICKILIERFRVILLTISSGYSIKEDLFKIFCFETAEMFVKLYPWYRMPTTVHKVLIHSADIIQGAILPIGQLGEEAQEARNKDIRRFREDHTRKFSRLLTITDIFNNLLVSSDPYITGRRKLLPRSNFTYPTEVLQFLVSPEIS